MSPPARRAADVIRVVDGLVESHLNHTQLGGRVMARLATAVAIEHSGARWGALLFDHGKGLEPTFKLAHDLRIPDDEGSAVDLGLVAEAETTRRVAHRSDKVAAPMILGGAIRGVLYLDGLDGRGEKTASLANHVAGRIATFLRSADLVDQVARQERGLEALERLAGMLGDRQLIGSHLELAADTARAATASDFALMARMADDGRLLGSSVHGRASDAITAATERLAAGLATRGELDRAEIPARQALAEPIKVEPMTATSAPRIVGFLVAGRNSERPYGNVDRTFLRALAHLLGGALAREDYFRRASIDPLTETGTRLALQLSLAEADNRRRSKGRPYTLLIADLDGFKAINDRYGHPVGDEVLRGVASLLRGRLRAQDFVARYGGDEFVLVLPETPRDEAASLARELSALVAAARFSEHGVAVSLSIGLATAEGDRAPDELLREADRALYEAKARAAAMAEPARRKGR